MIKALLVDDEPRVLEALEKNIKWKDCGIDYLFKAGTVDDAMQCYMAYEPDVIITDIEMPDGSGLELMEKLKARDAEVAYLCVTCHPEFDYMRRAMQLGSVDYILKPVEYQELEQVLKKIVLQIKIKKYGAADSYAEGQQTERESAENICDDEQLVFKVQQYIRQHLTENINVQELAGKFHCSTSHLMHSFKRKTGKTVIEYVTGERMEKAKNLLRKSNVYVNAVARLSGYEDYSYFSRVFKKETGQTPKEYRESQNHTNKI